MADIPILCFDGDAAGQKAALRAAHRALPMIAPGRTLSFALLPTGQDPDDLVNSGGAAAIEAVLGAAISLDELLWRSEHQAQPLSTPEARAGLRKRLGELAATVRDADVRYQYQAEFRRRFDELFASRPRRDADRSFRSRPIGQRGQWKAEPSPPSRAAHAVNASGIDPRMTRAVLAGLLRYPELFAENSELIGSVRIDDDALARLRSIAFDASFSSAALEKEALETILREAGLGAVVDELKATNTLAFSFLRGNADYNRAVKDLSATIEALAAIPLLDAALQEATGRFGMETSEEQWSEQQRLREALADARRALSDLAQDEDREGA